MMFKSKIHLEMIDASSKMSLKMSCLLACDNNVEKARDLYDFLSADIGDIPDVTPVRPGGFEQFKQGAGEIFGWLSSHKDEIVQGYTFIQSLRNPATSASAESAVPPIPKI